MSSPLTLHNYVSFNEKLIAFGSHSDLICFLLLWPFDSIKCWSSTFLSRRSCSVSPPEFNQNRNKTYNNVCEKMNGKNEWEEVQPNLVMKLCFCFFLSDKNLITKHMIKVYPSCDSNAGGVTTGTWSLCGCTTSTGSASCLLASRSSILRRPLMGIMYGRFSKE